MLDDAAWRSGNTTGLFVETRVGGPASVEARAKVSWDQRSLYVAFDVVDDLLLASDIDDDAHLWEQDCVELMIDPEGDGESYFEIEVSPREVVFDTRFDSRRVPAPFGHMDWDSEAQVAVRRRGELDDDKEDGGYTVEMAIPWQAFSSGDTRGRPPAIGDEWRINLYVIDRRPGGQRAAAWSPVGTGDFHVPWRFGRLTFASPETLESPGGPH